MFCEFLFLINLNVLKVVSKAPPTSEPSNAFLNLASKKVSSGSEAKYSNKGFCKFGATSFIISTSLPVSSSKAVKSAIAPIVVTLAILPAVDIGFTNFNGFVLLNNLLVKFAPPFKALPPKK